MSGSAGSPLGQSPADSPASRFQQKTQTLDNLGVSKIRNHSIGFKNAGSTHTLPPPSGAGNGNAHSTTGVDAALKRFSNDTTVETEFVEPEAIKRAKCHLVVCQMFQRMWSYDDDRQWQNSSIIFATLVIQALTSLTTQGYFVSYMAFVLVGAVILYWTGKETARAQRHFILGTSFIVLSGCRVALDIYMQFGTAFWYLLIPSAIVFLQMSTSWAFAVCGSIAVGFAIRAAFFSGQGALGDTFFSAVPMMFASLILAVYTCWRSERATRLAVHVCIGLEARLRKVEEKFTKFSGEPRDARKNLVIRSVFG
jgi:hypothetical protein